jgi:hypothetical protein
MLGHIGETTSTAAFRTIALTAIDKAIFQEGNDFVHRVIVLGRTKTGASVRPHR